MKITFVSRTSGRRAAWAYVEQLQLRVEQVAEIPKALRLGCPVARRVP
jgi:hypothetical protein